MGINPALALKVLCADPYVKEVASGDDCVYRQLIVQLPDQTIYATKDEVESVRRDSQQSVERAFKQAQSK